MTRARTIAVALGIAALALAAYLLQSFWAAGDDPSRGSGILAYLADEAAPPG